MFQRICRLLTICVFLTPPLSSAQEGFPLDGTWRGEWGTGPDINRIVVIMKWNGETITGRMNPGPRSFEFSDAELSPDDWTVRIEATDADGRDIVADGTLEDIGAYDRSISGTWTVDGVTHPFRITRE